MSDNIRRQQGAGSVWPWPVANPTLGVTADEIKVQRATLAKDPTIQPIPETRAMEFLSPTTSSEHLRLSPPAAANPMATATGPVLDHFKVRVALNKTKGPVAQEMHNFLQSPQGQALPEDRKTQMRASLARETALMTMMRSVNDQQERIYARVIGTSEA